MAVIVGNRVEIMALSATLKIKLTWQQNVNITRSGVVIASLTSDSSGNITYDVPAYYFGELTISVTDTYASGSASVTVSAAQEYTVNITVTRYAYRNLGSSTNNFNPNLGGQWWKRTDGGSATITNYNTYVQFQAGGGAGVQWCGTNSQINMSNYSSVKVKFTASRGANAGFGFIVFSTNSTSGVRNANAKSSWYDYNVSTQTTATINVKSVTGNKWFGIYQETWGTTSTIKVYEVALLP